MNQLVAVGRRALRILQPASTLDAIGQCWLGLPGVHLGAAVPLTTPRMMHVFDDVTDYRSTLLAVFNTAAADEHRELALTM